jgi:hypothetical protein
MTFPTLAEVEAITRISDPVVRNLRITQCYHELSRAFAERVSPGANWCTFATWASRQAGQTIRSEDLSRAADSILGSAEVRLLLERVVALAARELRGTPAEVVAASVRRILDPEAALRRASAAVAAGNLKVFEEIGHQFARWLSTVAATGTPDESAIEFFCDALRPGDPPGGQQLLVGAFRAYGGASGAGDPGARAERMLLANLLVGLHEQTRLQPDIAASLDAAIDEVETRHKLLTLLLPGWWLRLRAQVARMLGRKLPLDEAIDALIAAVRRKIRVVITDSLMTIRLPGTVLRLGRDVQGSFPAELAQLSNPALKELLARVDPVPDSVSGSGADDWSVLPQRMRFIADFFRAWHARAELLQPPFTAAQVAEMRGGRIPAGEL